MKVVFRIMDTDASRAQRAETMLYALLRSNGIEGRVGQVFEHLEFSRMGRALDRIAMMGRFEIDAA
jgi:hypothetical protein